MTMREYRTIWMGSRCSSSAALLFRASARESPGEVADQDDVVDCADDAVRDLKAFEVLHLEELLIDLSHDDSFNLFLVHVNDNILDFANKHAFVRVDLEPEQLGNLGFHRYQMKVYT